MALIRKVLAILLLVFIITVHVQAKPVEETKDVEGEMMETAEGQFPHPPRFAMQRFKERREHAQRRYNAQRRVNPSRRLQPRLYGYRRYYVSILQGCS